MHVTDHALDQLEARCGIVLDRKGFHRVWASATELYPLDNGDKVFSVVYGRKLGFVVASTDTVRTSLSLKQAFANRPVRMFGFLIESGHLKTALALKAANHRGTLDARSTLRYCHEETLNDLALWRAFRWVGQR
jgi:hypothetical protein